MADMIHTWLDEDRTTMHHAPATQIDGMQTGAFEGTTSCGRTGLLKLVHTENVDRGKLCPACVEVNGTAPSLAGTSVRTP